jgi:hypothetical protein
VKQETKEEKTAADEKEAVRLEEGLVKDPSRCKYGYYKDSGNPSFYRCQYGGSGTHICKTLTGLKECVVRGDKAFNCEELSRDLRSRDCCQELYGGFSTGFTLNHCGTY